MTGRFVVVEGPDGAGKTTLIANLTHRLDQNGVDHITVREPGGTAAAEYARSGAFDRTLDASPLSELFFFLAARADLVTKVIRPALSAGKLVLSDRYQLSTFAYQVGGRGLPEEDVRAANDLATGGLSPDLTLILDLPVHVSKERQELRGRDPDRLEREGPEFHERVARAFLMAEGPAFQHIDATNPPAIIEDLAWEHLANVLDGTKSGRTGSS